ncbi:MAG: permease-like cell division protein FtsX [Kineosporiaceae bacterium]|jgi:cell division transport system permease protein
MRFQFVLSEIGIGLRRNLSMTISVILVTTVSLLLLGVGILAQKQVASMKSYWYDRVQVSIFLCGKDSDTPSCADGEVSADQRTAIRSDLESPALKPYVDTVFYETKDDAFVHFKEQFKGSVLADNVTADQMPESFRVKLKDPEQFAVVSDAFRDRQGVERVQDQNELLDRLFALLNGLKWGAWFVAGLTLLCTVLLVATTIRLTAFTRRRETGIMRLVGASNLVIQLPFVLEGMIAAFVGAILASGILMAFTHFAIQGWLKDSLRFIDNYVDVGDALSIVPLLFVVGLLIAGVSSFLSLRRYLKV